ncbi:AraC family transcriptional regulator [Candidatus Woesearchaeota archaeon]|nr:AraC family transcriptional regulator [Candidatus Woesearchaeota archaeon]
MQPKFVEKEDIKIVGMVCNTTMKNEKHKQDCQELWREFMPKMIQIKNKVNKDVAYGICIEDKKDPDDFIYVAGVEVESFKDIPKGMIIKTIPASKYAIFTHKGIVDQIGKSWNYIFSEWLPKSGIELNKNGLYFEYYDRRYREGASSETDIYIPIR